MVKATCSGASRTATSTLPPGGSTADTGLAGFGAQVPPQTAYVDGKTRCATRGVPETQCTAGLTEHSGSASVPVESFIEMPTVGGTT